MLMTRDEFLRWPRKAVTLLGMSGVGKTTLANKLPRNRWFHYSGDYRIGTKYLEEPILDNFKRQAMQVGFLRDLLRSDSIYIASNITVDNLDPISTFLGKIGKPDAGGLPLAEFKRRQRLHMGAEAAAMRDVEAFIGKARDIYGYDHLLNDAGGSICEIDDEGMIRALTEHTLILYLQAGDDMEQELIRRAIASPKPLYYREDFLDRQLAVYLREHGNGSADEIDPDRFVRWIFPQLLRHRRPRYEAMARQYGYTVNARDLVQVREEADFLALVADAIDRKTRGG
ncbi:MAG: ATPase [Gammaproteobacteria bacterium]|nr:ATPase [Gammaproteobacteria bacterium]